MEGLKLSYNQRTTTTVTPFAQVTNSSNWGIGNTFQPDTVSETWLTSVTGGYEFIGKGYMFGFLIPTDAAISAVGVGDDTTPDRYTCGYYFYPGNAGRAFSDDEFVNYGTTVRHRKVDPYYWPQASNQSRINVMRVEG